MIYPLLVEIVPPLIWERFYRHRNNPCTGSNRNSSGFWNNASSFLGSDLSQGNVELIQDNSTIAPEFNFTVTDGQTTLPAAPLGSI